MKPRCGCRGCVFRQAYDLNRKVSLYTVTARQNQVITTETGGQVQVLHPVMHPTLPAQSIQTPPISDTWPYIQDQTAAGLFMNINSDNFGFCAFNDG